MVVRGGGGGAGGEVVEPPPPHTEGGASWTLLVYMVADTNLEYDALNDLQEMAAVGSGEGFNIIVQADRTPEYTPDGVLNLENWDQSLRLKVMADSLEVVEDQGEVNMGDPATLADFVSWGIATYPADKYGLVFWDHGGGWVGFGDDESHDHDGLTLNEIRRGIEDGLAATDVSRFQFIGFDACLMATWETAVTLEYHAEYLLASEELEPGHGWDYRALQGAKDDPTTSAADLTSALVDGFVGQAEEAGTAATITLSVTDLTLVHQVSAAVKQFAETALPVLPDLLNTIGRERAQVEEYGPLVDPRAITGMVDLGDIVRRIADADATLADARTAVDAALSAAVVKIANGVAHGNSNGLSIFFPQFPEYYSPGYDDLEGIGAWRDLVKAYHNGGASVPEGAVPVFIDEGHVASGVVEEGELVITANLSPESAPNVSRSVLYYGVVDETGTYLFGDTFAVVDTGDAAGLVTGVWDLTAMYITDGNNSAYCYLALEDRGDSLFATIPFVYEDTNGDQLLTVLAFAVDAETGDILSTNYYAQTGGGWAELNPEDGALLYPLIQTPGENGLEFVLTSNVGFDIQAEATTFDFSDLEAGTGVLGALEAVNFAGQGDLIIFQGQL
ncbi:clostripain-related cysteine peptidase [Myxococcota bacterium]|nr:clostripain-related cysteine peptidase [Myxococcota bacterium]